MGKIPFWVVCVLLVGLLVGCAPSAPYPGAGEANSGIPEPTLTAHAEVVYAEATATQQAWDVRLAEAQALEATAVYARQALEATQQAIRDEEARQALEATQAAQAVETQTAGAATQQAAALTQAAQATETQRAWEVLQWQMRGTDTAATSTAVMGQAQATGTAIAGAMIAERTATAESLQATIEAAQAAAEAALAQAQAERAKLAVERERTWNEVRAGMPYIVGAVLMGLLVVLAVYFASRRPREVIRDAEGNPKWVIEELRGRTNVLLPGRSAGPGLISSKEGVDGFDTPAPMQERVTARDQLIDAIRRQGGSQVKGDLTTNNPGGQWSIVELDQLPGGIVDDETRAAIEADWREEE